MYLYVYIIIIYDAIMYTIIMYYTVKTNLTWTANVS